MILKEENINEIFKIINEKNIKHISFDFWNTLYESNPEFKVKRNSLLSKLSKLDIEQIEYILNDKSKSFNSQFKESSKTVIHSDLIKSVFNTLNIDYIFIDDVFKLFLKYSPITSPKINSLFEDIANKEITISLLSNTAYIPGSEITKVLKKDNCLKYFSFLLFSDEMNYGKPNILVFQKLRSEINKVKPNISNSEILHIGDDLDFDITPSINFGLSTLKI
jgi:putative hydrolase of the HAD superfamily